MVDKAQIDSLNGGRQAGADDYRRIFPSFHVPDGLSLGDIEAAEDLVLDWKHSGESRAVDLVVKVYERLMAAVHKQTLFDG
jgi:hypothetical protein